MPLASIASRSAKESHSEVLVSRVRPSPRSVSTSLSSATPSGAPSTVHVRTMSSVGRGRGGAEVGGPQPLQRDTVGRALEGERLHDELVGADLVEAAVEAVLAVRVAVGGAVGGAGGGPAAGGGRCAHR